MCVISLKDGEDKRGYIEKARCMYPQASCDRTEGYKEVSLGRSIRKKEIHNKPRAYPPVKGKSKRDTPTRQEHIPRAKKSNKGADFTDIQYIRGAQLPCFLYMHENSSSAGEAKNNST